MCKMDSNAISKVFMQSFFHFLVGIENLCFIPRMIACPIISVLYEMEEMSTFRFLLL